MQNGDGTLTIKVLELNDDINLYNIITVEASNKERHCIEYIKL